MSETVGAQLAKGLLAHGVDLLYCVPGESYLGLTDALTDFPSLRLIVCRHEGGAAFMAVADGRMRNGRAGVCVVSRGPGLANAMVAIHSAYHDATPLVVLVGQVESHDFGRLALQEQNYSVLLADVTKLVIEVQVASRATEALARAFHVAESGTPGPVAVVLPEDILDTMVSGPIAKPRSRVVAGPLPEAVEELAHRLEVSERPLVWVGGGVDPNASHELVQLSEQWGLPVSPTHRRPHLFDSMHPNYGGYIGIRVEKSFLAEMMRSDLLLALGERLTDTVSQSYTFPTAPEPQLPLVHVWPDATEVGRVWRADLGIVCDPAALIRSLLNRKPPMITQSRRQWIESLNRLHRQLSEPKWESTSDGVNFAAVCCEVAKHLEKDAAVTSDAGNFGSFVHRYIPFRPGQVFLSSVVGAMGSGVPMVVAAALRRPGRQAVAFVGDGGALMSGNELATARLYGVAPIIIISDNSGYGTISMHQAKRYPNRPFKGATKLYSPNFADWARSFGAEGFTICQEHEVSSAIMEAFSIRNRPVVVHVKTSAVQTNAWWRHAD